MANKSVELLLTESVENLGIVGDVVKVRTGYARNFLLPRNLATTPSQELIDSLRAKRAEAERQMAELRQQRQAIISKLEGYEFELVRSCNDMGVLYGAVTQQEIATSLTSAGYAVRPRDVRLSETIKRVGDYEILVKYETELETKIKLHVKADRELEKDEKADMDFDDEGNLIVPGQEGRRGGRGGRRGNRPEAAPEQASGPADAASAPSADANADANADAQPKKASKKKA